MTERQRLLIHVDGGARGNPGPAAIGVVVSTPEGDVIDEVAERIGVATNNVAEYRGLVAGLARAIDLAATEVEVVSDSELLVKQMRGEYRVKKESLRELSIEAASLARRLSQVEYRHVPRARNELADRLVNDALDAA